MTVLLGGLYEQEHCHPENNNIHLGSAWQSLATNNCPTFQRILLHLFCSINISQSTDAIICNATQNHGSDFSV
jgi:hypothetical protein